jgi:muramoyltetrapeptide carboxypeptidase
MKAKRIPHNGTIGIFCPSHVANMERYAPTIAAIERLGFNVKLGANILKDTYGYAASAEERAADLNALVADDSVQMVLFSGGESAAEILPLIDYENICRNPKLFSNYSDGTPILNAIYAQTGLVTYYGIGTSEFSDLRHYDYMQFCSHFVEGYSAERFVNDSKWKTLRGGNCEGTLIGGYSSLFALMLFNQYFKYNSDKKYLLFLETSEKYSKVGAIATELAFIGQNAFMRNVAGLIFGHYSVNVPDVFLCCLERFGTKHNIPVVYTDDFGHGTRHGILPIGINASLDADEQTLVFLDDTVSGK